MIIDCRKMTPVQSQYCMFSIIISCHFSHSHHFLAFRVETHPVAFTSNTTAPQFYNWALDIYNSQSQCDTVNHGWTGDFGICTWCEGRQWAEHRSRGHVASARVAILGVAKLSPRRGLCHVPCRLHRQQHRSVVHHLPCGQGDGEISGLPVLQGHCGTK